MSRELLQRITRDDVSATGQKFRDVRRTVVGGVPVYLVWLSFSGELGFEMYCEPQFQLTLWEHVTAAGADLGLKPYGARALMSLRLEKHWGVWTLDYRPDYTAAESGLDTFIDWKRDFVGRAAAAAERERGPTRRLVTLVVDVADRDVVGDEAILQGDRCVGHVTSGGYAHHLGCSMAMGYVPPDCVMRGASSSGVASPSPAPWDSAWSAWRYSRSWPRSCRARSASALASVFWAGAGFLVWRSWVRPLRSVPNMAVFSRLVEERRDFRDMLRAALEFSQRGAPGDSSADLVGATIDRAYDEARGLDLVRLFAFPARQRDAAVAGITAVALASFHAISACSEPISAGLMSAGTPAG